MDQSNNTNINNMDTPNTKDTDSTKPNNYNNSVDEENIFSILAHPIRRKILKLLYNQRSATFTILMEELNISTGSIYHHLKELDDLIDQSENKSYILTLNGLTVVELYLKQSRTKVERIKSYTYLTNKIFNVLLERNQIILIFVFGLNIFGNIVVSEFETILLGPIILPSSQIQITSIRYLSIIYTIFHVILYYILVYLARKQPPRIKRVIQIYILSTFAANFIIILFFITLQLTVINTTIWIFIILNLISQITFVLIITSGTIQYHGISVSNSVIITLSLLYVSLFLNLLI